MRTVKTTSKWTKMDLFNVVRGTGLADAVGTHIKVRAIALGEDVSAETGELVATGYIATFDNQLYTTVSRTAIQQLDALADMLDTDLGGEVTLEVHSQNCKKDSKNAFLYFDII